MDGRVPMGSSTDDMLTASEWMQQYLGKQEPVVRSRVVRWWYRLTSPVEPVKGGGFIHQESLRRGRLVSKLLFIFLFLLLVLLLPVSIFTNNLILIIVVGALLLLVLIAALCNRYGKSRIAGLLLVIAFSTGLDTIILMSPGGLTADSLFFFDLLIFSELFVAFFLPLNWIFLAALLNSVFIISTLTLMSEAPDLAMHANTYVLLLRPVALQFIVSLVLWFWGGRTARMIRRAERFEALAMHQHALAMQEHIVARQKRALDASIEQIMHTHIQVANGDLGARVPLDEGTLLWPMAIALNNLLNRMQRLQQIELEFVQMLPRFQRGNLAEYELQRAKNEMELLLLCIRDARQEKRCIRALRSGTLLDPLVEEINGRHISVLPLSMRQTSGLLPLHTDCASTIIVNESDGEKF